MVFQECESTGGAADAKNQIQPFAVAKNDHEYKKISACIRFHAELLHLLNFRQPLSAKELLSEIGFSKQKLLRDLKQLQKYNVVKKISFEAHVLYVINGNLNSLIRSVLHL